MILVAIGFAALVTALVICTAGIFGVIKKSPDDHPYNYLLDVLIFGGAGCALCGTLIVILSKR